MTCLAIIPYRVTLNPHLQEFELFNTYCCKYMVNSFGYIGQNRNTCSNLDPFFQKYLVGCIGI